MADVEAPVGIEVIHPPVVALHLGQLVDHRGQMGGKIGAGAHLAQIPDALTRGDDKRGDTGPHPMPDVLVRAFFWLARLDGLGRIAPLENLPPCFFISAEDEASCLGKAQSLARE